MRKNDIKDFFKILWTERILIIFVTISTSLLTFLFYNSSLNPHRDTNQIVQVIIKDPEISAFFEVTKYVFESKDNGNDPFSLELTSKLRMSFIENFYNSFTLSSEIKKFVEQNNDIDDFKNYLTTNRINLNIYFDRSIRDARINSKIKNSYTFKFNSNILDGKKFLNDYVEFTKKETIKNTIIEFRKFYKHIRDRLELQIAMHTIQEGSSAIINNNKKIDIEVLKNKIKILDQALNNMDNDSIDYNPFVSTAYQPKVFQNFKVFGKITALFIGAILGFFLSLFFILLKSLYRK